jgi:hypothetical protein
MSGLIETALNSPITNTKGMHPGVIDGARLYPKVDTSMPYKKGGGGKLGKAMKRLGERRVAHSMTLKSLPQNCNPAGFKVPGSMKQK